MALTRSPVISIALSPGQAPAPMRRARLCDPAYFAISSTRLCMISHSVYSQIGSIQTWSTDIGRLEFFFGS